MAAAMLSLSALAGGITVKISRQPLSRALEEIEKVSDVRFFYESSLPKLSTEVQANFKDATVEEALAVLLKGTDIAYTLKDNGATVVLHKKDAPKNEVAAHSPAGFRVSGTINDSQGEPLVGATVRNVTTGKAVVTDFDGNYALGNVHKGDKIEVTYVGFSPMTFVANGNQTGREITLTETSTALNDVVVVGYGTQKKVNLTGAVSVVKAEDIGGRPTSNAATALLGADPSLNLTMGSG